MADMEVNETLSAAAVNATMNETATNATLSGRAAATPEGLLVAYTSLVIMALLPIWFGSFRSVAFNKKQKVNNHRNRFISLKSV